MERERHIQEGFWRVRKSAVIATLAGCALGTALAGMAGELSVSGDVSVSGVIQGDVEVSTVTGQNDGSLTLQTTGADAAGLITIQSANGVRSGDIQVLTSDAVDTGDILVRTGQPATTNDIRGDITLDAAYVRARGRLLVEPGGGISMGTYTNGPRP